MEAIGMKGKKGQGATEYLVLLAVVLIIALVAIALLGFFPGLAGEARITQSDAYWRGARPFSIIEHSQVANATSISLVMRNSEPGKLTITAIKLDGNGSISGNVVFIGGETKAINVTSIATCGSSGAGYEYDSIEITYNSKHLTGQKQFGAKSLIGKCT